MQQSLGQNQLGQSPQMVQQSSIAQAQQQMVQSQLTQQQQQQIAQSQITHQQIAQSQLAQQQIAQSQLAQQQQIAQSQIAQQHLAQQQLAQSQIAQQQMAQSQLAQQQMAQSQLAQQQISQPQIVQQQITQPQMIQQQIAQQQMSQQQLQQMMYCPTVRLVYDTPMQLMQSGDQIQQQNQNIFVNQPPWARPVQNQVIYVQQIGSNLVPVQHLDPNMFLQQNIPMYQQVVQNVPQLVQNLPQTVQSLPQGQIRQIINNIPAGMVSNFGTNVQRIQEPNLGQMIQNFGLVQANTDVSMNNVNVSNNEADRQAITNQGNAQPNAPTQELMHVYRQIIPQMNQQQQTKTQVPVSQQHTVQNMQTVGHQIVTNSMGQTIGTNIRPITNVANTPSNIGLKINNVRPNTTQIVQNAAPNTNHIIRTSSSPNVTNVAPTSTGIGTNMQQIRHIVQTQNVNIAPQNHPQNSVPMQSFATSVGTLNTVTYSAVRNGQPYTYRAIQPKPNSNIRVNFKPRVNQMPMVRRPVAPNTPNINQHVPISTINTIPTSTIKMETDSPTFNRKRKSESPDEIHKKISNYGSITVTAQVKDKIKAKYANTSEIGVNTSPVHKMHKVSQNKVESQLPLLQINPMEAKIKQEFLSPTTVAANVTTAMDNSANVSIKTEAGTEVKDKKDSIDVSQQTEEKLVRKTVFPQAKSTGRLLDAKASLDMPKLDDTQTDINIIIRIANESIQEPQICEPKNNSNNNNINNTSQQVPQINYKQSNTINEKIKPEEAKVVKSATPITNPNTTTEPVIGTQKPINTSKNNKPDDMKVVLPTKKDVRSISQLSEAKISELTEAKNIEKPKTETNEDISTKVAEKAQTGSNLNTETLAVSSKIEIPVTDTNVTTDSDINQEINDSKIEKKEYKNISVSEIKGKEIHIVDGNIREEKRDFVLTHVLDGFVIQESNVPFAIRRPLKEKTVNAYVEDKNDPCIKAAKDEIRGHILELSQLHLNESKEKERLDKETRLNEKEEEDIETKEDETIATESKAEETNVENDITKDNPFESLKQTIVKSWTIEDLASHLTKYSWTDTVSTLQEHEIDGESLFLVTKTQLTSIGVTDTHADVICEFVGSKN